MFFLFSNDLQIMFNIKFKILRQKSKTEIPHYHYHHHYKQQNVDRRRDLQKKDSEMT